MVNASGRWPACAYRGIQGRQGQLGVDLSGDGIAHDLAAARVEDGSEVAEADRQADVGDVANPDEIRPGRDNVSVEDWTHATEASQGWQAIEDELRLSGWSKARRVVVLRRRIKHDIALTAKKRGHSDAAEQLVLALPHDEVQDNAQVWEYTVLATNAQYDIAAIGQLYRDRCDCENGFDELKNQGLSI
jgi:hypothetical protein